MSRRCSMDEVQAGERWIGCVHRSRSLREGTYQEFHMAKAKTAMANKTAETNPDLATVSGIAAGAAVGSLLGPMGAAVGAVVGGVAGQNVGKPSKTGRSTSSNPLKKATAKVKTAATKTKAVAKKAITRAKKSTAKTTQKPTARKK